ncbi:MAG: ABC transporter substrate-binding protein [Candidatus Hodarchaeales archaeon]|jgi:maltose-binding protein MalE
MKKFALGLSLLMFLSLLAVTNVTVAKPQLTDFEIVMPWGTDHERGKIIMSMVGNSTIGTDYNFIYTAVGGGPADRDALTARFLAGDFPNMLIVTQDWYTEFSEFGIWHNFAPEIAAWSAGRAGWVDDIPDGWWSILDREKGDGLGSKVYALPMFGQSVLPYLNTDHFTAAGMNATELAVDWTMDEFMDAAYNLSTAGYTPFAMVGKLQSDIAYMNYMMGSTNDYITANTDPASVYSYSWPASDEYGVNGSLSVNGLARYMELKGEGLVQSTVDTDGGGEVNAIFTAGNASMVFVGPWGTSIFEANPKTNFTAASMPRNENGERSTITGGGISLVPVFGDNTNLTTRAAAVALAQDLLEDGPQLKTVSNYLNVAWRIPVRTSVQNNPWFDAFPNRTNFKYHIDSQSYAYAWGKQHPKWIEIHESVMMPGYRDALLTVTWNQSYTAQDYQIKAQSALDTMADTIQEFYLVNIPSTVTGTTVVETTVVHTTVVSGTTVYSTVIERAPGFTFLFGLVGLSIIIYYKKRDKK